MSLFHLASVVTARDCFPLLCSPESILNNTSGDWWAGIETFINVCTPLNPSCISLRAQSEGCCACRWGEAAFHPATKHRMLHPENPHISLTQGR